MILKSNDDDYIFYKQPDPKEIVQKRKESHRCWEMLDEEAKTQVMMARGFLKGHSHQDT